MYKSINEPVELSVPISNLKIVPPQQETLDSIITRALNRIDPYIEYIIREKIKLYPKTLNKKTNGNLTFESEIIQLPRNLTNEELNEVYEAVCPVWVSKSVKIDERRPEYSQFLIQDQPKPVEPIRYKQVKPVIPQKQVPIKFMEDNLESLTLEYPFKSESKRPKFLTTHPQTKQSNLVEDSHFKKLKNKMSRPTFWSKPHTYEMDHMQKTINGPYYLFIINVNTRYL